MRLLTKQETIQYAIENEKYYKPEDFPKHYHVIDTGHGMVEIDKPSIENEIWYDDETPNPFGDNNEHKKAAFKSRNMQNLYLSEQFEEWLECKREYEEEGVTTGAWVAEPYTTKKYRSDGRLDFVFFVPRYTYKHQDDPTKTPLSEDEIAELKAISDEIKAQFEKRLETYYKRYSDKIFSRGYWANE